MGGAGPLALGSPLGNDPLVGLPGLGKSRTRRSGADEGVRPTSARFPQKFQEICPVRAIAGGSG